MPAGGLAPNANLPELLLDVLAEHLHGPARTAIFGLLVARDVVHHDVALVRLQDQLRVELEDAIDADAGALPNGR